MKCRVNSVPGKLSKSLGNLVVVSQYIKAIMFCTWWYWVASLWGGTVIMGQCNVEKIWNSTVLRFFFAWLPQPNDPRAGLTWSVKKLIFFRLLQWQNDNIFKHQYILIHKEGKLHSVRNIWTGNVFLQEKPGSHTEHNVVLVDWTHCQVNLLIINLCIILQGRLLSNRKHSSLHMFGLALIYIRVNQASRHADFLHTQTLAQMGSGHPIWICLNLKLGVAMLGKEGSFENDLIHSDWHFASIDKMHIISKFHTLQTVT